MLASIKSYATCGLNIIPLTINVHISRGLPQFNIVGLAQTCTKESKYRVRSAILNSGYEFPNQNILVNLAPAHIPKFGSDTDLGIAIAILAATAQIPNQDLSKYHFSGELNLAGQVSACPNLASILLNLQQNPTQLITGLPLNLPANIHQYHSDQIIYLTQLKHFTKAISSNYTNPIPTPTAPQNPQKPAILINDIHGQKLAKYCLLLAGAGGHNLLLQGPPGSGKSMISQALHGLLPQLSPQASLEKYAIHNQAQLNCNYDEINSPPLRSPHYNISKAGLLGGGNPPAPGEISLAHGGILFLDEMPEFGRDLLEGLRTPLEEKHINLSRANYKITYPSNFLLLGAMNMCPCGNYGGALPCNCSNLMLKSYQNRISGALRERFDLTLTIKPIASSELFNQSTSADSAKLQSTYQEKIQNARLQQLTRQNCLNSELTSQQILKLPLTEQAQDHLRRTLDAKLISTRTALQSIKVAQTISDLQKSTIITLPAIAEALQLTAR